MACGFSFVGFSFFFVFFFFLFGAKLKCCGNYVQPTQTGTVCADLVLATKLSGEWGRVDSQLQSVHTHTVSRRDLISQLCWWSMGAFRAVVAYFIFLGRGLKFNVSIKHSSHILHSVEVIMSSLGSLKKTIKLPEHHLEAALWLRMFCKICIIIVHSCSLISILNTFWRFGYFKWTWVGFPFGLGSFMVLPLQIKQLHQYRLKRWVSIWFQVYSGWACLWWESKAALCVLFIC